VDIVKLTPAHLRLLAGGDYKNSKIKRMIVGGEQLETKLAKEITENLGGRIEIYNEYGPTETVVGCMIYKYDIQIDKTGAVPIGIPGDNVSIYILDVQNHLQPQGIPGELCIGGGGVARGYLNQPDLTEEKFVSNPFKKGEIMYRTGDLAKMLPDGNIEFLGRIDHQVKIRGFRIELGEIESTILKQANVKEAIVMTQNLGGQEELVCYVVSKKKGIAVKLKEHLKRSLPEYMVPCR